MGHQANYDMLKRLHAEETTLFSRVISSDIPMLDLRAPQGMVAQRRSHVMPQYLQWTTFRLFLILCFPWSVVILTVFFYWPNVTNIILVLARDVFLYVELPSHE